MLIKRIAKLKEHILSQSVSNSFEGNNDLFAVFLSVCNKKERAKVFHGTGSSLSAAWVNAEKRLTEFQKKRITRKKPLAAAWAKADIVTNYQEVPVDDLRQIINKYELSNFTRVGLSFDRNFSRAFIEAEVNANKMLKHPPLKDNETPIDLKSVNRYLKSYSMSPVTEMPDKLTIFTARGFFCDESGAVHELYHNDSDYGRRKIGVVDDKILNDIIIGASLYLVNLIGDNGKFIYGYYPASGNEIDNYNIVRHAGTIWSIINLYRMRRDDGLIGKLDKAIDYMYEAIDCKDADTAYLIEIKSNEVKLGANGVAVIMLTEYMSVFSGEKHLDMVKKLANGILELQNPETGKYWHVLNFPDYSKKEEFRTIYYDGEAAFALARAYSVTKDEKYLNGAKAAIEYFIANKYSKYRDHWVSYSVLEVLKYVSDPRYYDFGIQNFEDNRINIYGRARSYQTNLELMMASWQIYQKAVNEGIKSGYIQNYDPAPFAKTIYHRARHMLNGYFYPEHAMYMKYPSTVEGSFFMRDDNFRVRIDDVQHFIGGYYFYCLYFNEIRRYLDEPLQLLKPEVPQELEAIINDFKPDNSSNK